MYVGCDASETRVDCHPEPGATQERCIARGCCWHPEGENWCFRPNGKGNFIAIVIVRASISIYENLTYYTSFSSILQSFHTKKNVARTRMFLVNASNCAIQLMKSFGGVINMAMMVC